MFLILGAILIAAFVYFKIIRPYAYWIDRGVKQRKQTYLFGDTVGVIFGKENIWDLALNLYNAFPGERYMGSYQMTQPVLVVRDPDLIKRICIRDFDHFVDHMQFVPEGLDELFNKNLLALKGNRWRDMRSTLSPSFTSSKMRIIFNLVSECAADFTHYFLETGGTHSVELKDIFTRYTNDVIATTAFGIKCDSMKDRENEFYLMGKEATTFVGFWSNLKMYTMISAPRIAKLFGLKLFTNPVRMFFTRVIKEAVVSREELGIVRPDMLQLLIEARNGRRREEETEDPIEAGFATVQESKLTTSSNNKIAKQHITDLDMVAQALIFFFGGFEIVSTLMCFLGHEFVENPEVQRKLQKEVDETLKNCWGKLTYEALLKMKYMDMVISEALRKWPATITNDRICTKPYTIQPTRPTEKPIKLEKGDAICIPINGIHRDPQYYPDPDRFDPERFNDENVGDVCSYTYLPFGSGPRNCIGSRFALIECKTLIFHLLAKFDLVEVERTSMPLKLSKESMNLMAENGFWIGLKPRTHVN